MNIFDSWLVKTPIAHRGLHGNGIPELSLASFEEAIKNGYAIELDVRELKDGTVVVFHDDSLGRMTGANGYVAQLTYEEIKDLKLEKSNEHIPTLKQTLELVAGRTPLLIEIKNMNKVGFEKTVWEELKSYKGEFAIQSFNPSVLEWFKNNAPHVKRGQVSSFFKGEDMSLFKKIALKKMNFNKRVSEPNFITYQTENLPNRFVKKYSELPVLAYTVRTEEEQERVANHSDNIIFENIRPNK